MARPHTKGETISDWEVMTMIHWLRSVHKAPLQQQPSTVSDLCDGFVLRTVLHAMEPDSFDEPRIIQCAVAPLVGGSRLDPTHGVRVLQAVYARVWEPRGTGTNRSTLAGHRLCYNSASLAQARAVRSGPTEPRYLERAQGFFLGLDAPSRCCPLASTGRAVDSAPVRLARRSRCRRRASSRSLRSWRQNSSVATRCILQARLRPAVQAFPTQPHMRRSSRVSRWPSKNAGGRSHAPADTRHPQRPVLSWVARLRPARAARKRPPHIYRSPHRLSARLERVRHSQNGQRQSVLFSKTMSTDGRGHH